MDLRLTQLALLPVKGFDRVDVAAVLRHQVGDLVRQPRHGLLVLQHQFPVVLVFPGPVDEVVEGVHILQQVAVFDAPDTGSGPGTIQAVGDLVALGIEFVVIPGLVDADGPDEDTGMVILGGNLNQKPVAEYAFLRDPHLDGFTVVQDDQEISSSEVDTARFEVSFVDQIGHVCTFYNGVLQIETQGDIELIGPKFLAPAGGRIAFWVKSVPTGKDSTATVTVKAPALPYPDQVFQLHLKKDL